MVLFLYQSFKPVNVSPFLSKFDVKKKLVRLRNLENSFENDSVRSALDRGHKVCQTIGRVRLA